MRKAGPPNWDFPPFFGMLRLPHYNQPDAAYKILRTGDSLLTTFFHAREVVDLAAQAFKADHYYKTMGTWKQLVFMLYGVVSKAQSLNSLCKCLLFLEHKLINSI